MLRKISKIILSTAMVLTMISWNGIAVEAQEENLALNRPVTVSGIEGGYLEDGSLKYPQFEAANLTDGDDSTRWSSDEALTSIRLEDNPDQNVWASVDLGDTKEIATIVMKWQKANSRDYDVQVSLDGEEWIVLHHYEDPDNDGQEYTETLTLDEPVQARYVRIYARLGTVIASIDNMQCPTISLYELEVYPYSDGLSLEKVLDDAMQQSVQTEGDHLLLPEVPSGYKIELYASSNTAVINNEGKIITPLEDMTVNLFYAVSDEDGNTLKSDEPKKITIAGAYTPQESVNQKPKVVPELREWKGDEGDFIFNGRIIIADAQLNQTAKQIAMYFAEMSGITCSIGQGTAQKGDILLALDKNSVLGEEGYEIDIGDILTIRALTETGILYGGTSVSQILSQDPAHKTIPKGQVRDYPQFAVRAIMLDVARQYIPLEYLSEMTRYAGYFKLSEFRNHINDNGGEQSAMFRLESKVYPQLNADVPKEQIYSQEDYIAYQKEAKTYGVDVVTEIDTPAHAGAFGKIDETLLMDGYHLDLRTEESYQKAITVMKNLFDELLDGADPVIQNGKFHIGTDEYDKSYSEVVRRYINELIEYVNAKGFETRFWASLGSNGFNGTTPVSTDAIAHMWSHSWASFDEMKEAGYSFINNADGILYIVPWAGYNNYLDIENLYDTWEYSNLNGGHELATGHPQLLGAEAALWYDLKVGASEFDIFDRLRDQIMLMAEKGWYGEDDDETGSQFIERVDTLGKYAPNANPARYVESKTSLVASYDFDDVSGNTVKDASENGYDAQLHDLYTKDDALRLKGEGYLALPFDSLGYPYTLQCDITIDSATAENALLFEGKDGSFYYNYDGTGCFGYERKGYSYIIDADVPIGMKFTMTITCDQSDTSLYINGMYVGSGEYYQVSGASKQGSSTFVMPLEKIGEGIYGSLDNLKLYNYVMSSSQIAGAGEETAESSNIALHKPVEVSDVEGGYKEDGTLVYPQFDPANATDGSESTRISLNRDDDAWVSVDLEQSYLLDQVIIRFNELPNAFAILVSEDNENWTQVGEYRNLNGGSKQVITVAFDTLVKARYVKYQQLEQFTLATTGAKYSGNFSEFEVYGYDTQRFVQFVEEAQERFAKCDDKSAYAQSVLDDLQTLKDIMETGPIATMNHLAELIDGKLTMLENETAPDASPDKTKLKELLEEELDEQRYAQREWEKYVQTLTYGTTIYYHAGADQTMVDYACQRIEAAKANLSMRNFVTVATNKSIYQDYELSRLIDGEPSSLTWLQSNQTQGDYILFTFREPMELSQIDIYAVNAGLDILHHGKVEIADEDGQWQSVGEIGENEHETLTFDKQAVTAVRITVTQSVEYWWKITEVMFNYAPLQDKKVLEEELNKKIDLDAYNDTSVHTYQEAWNQANAVYENKNAVQPQIDDAVAKLRNARAALEKKLDKSMLEALLETKIDKDAYTPSSYAAYESALKEAQSVYSDNDATQNDVDRAVWELQEALSRLIVADFKDKLNDLIVKALLFDENEYTTVSWSSFADALKQARQTAKDETASKQEVQKAYENLQQTMDALQQKASASLMEALQTITEQAAAMQKAELKEAVENAQRLLDDADNASSTEVISALLQLNEAMQEIEQDPSTEAYRIQVEELIDLIQSSISSHISEAYPDEVQALKAAVSKAEEAVKDQYATIEQLKEVKNALLEKAKELWKQVSLTQLKAMLQTIDLIEEGSYSEESEAVLKDAVRYADTILEKEDASFAEVSQALTKLSAAIAQLEKVVIDTSELEEEMKLAQAILDDKANYVEATVEYLSQQLELAKNMLVHANSQAEIDAMTKALREARSSVQLKAADDKEEDKKPADQTNTSASMPVGMFAVLLLVSAAVLVLLFRKKRG